MSETKSKIAADGDVTKDDGELVFDPFNPNNREITQKEVQTILETYGIPGKVHNFNLYRRAFIHKSYVKRPFQENEKNGIVIVDKPKDCMSLKTKSNERLEFLGDGVLECITKYYLYRRFPKANEGFMTEKKIALVKNESIGKMVYEMGLNKWYILSKNAEEKKTRTNLKKLGCLFEAFLGALFLDFNKINIHDTDKWFDNVFVTGPGFQMAQIFVESIFEKHVDWIALLQNDDNYKNILQVKLQKSFKVTPVYLEITHQDEDTGYHMGVFLLISIPLHIAKTSKADPYSKYNTFDNIHKHLETNDGVFILLGESKHKIKKKAEQMACKLAIETISQSEKL